MSLEIHYKKSVFNKNSLNSILFVEEKFNIKTLKKHMLSTEYSFINDILKTKDLEKEIISIDLSSKRKVVLVSIKKNLKNSDLEFLGGKFFDLFKDSKENEYILNTDTIDNFCSKIQFIKVDFPAFGKPTIPINPLL